VVTRDVTEGREIEFNVRACTHRIALVGHKVSETVKLCVAAIYTNPRNDGINFFKIPSLVVLTQRWARHVLDRTRDIGAFCRNALHRRTFWAGVNHWSNCRTDQAGLVHFPPYLEWQAAPELFYSSGLAVAVEVELLQALKQLQTVIRGW